MQQYVSSPAVYRRRCGLYLNRRLPRAANRDHVIATALGYEMLRAPSKATSLADRERERAQMTLDGHAKAVDILVQVKGLSESDALEQMYAWLLGHSPGRRRLRAAPPQEGSIPPCAAIRDLLGALRRESRRRFAGRECSPA